MTNLQELTHEELNQLQQDVLAEQTRRDTLDNTVQQVKSLGVSYEAQGGDRAELVAALQEEAA